VILRTSWVYAPVGRNFVNTLLKVFREHARARVVMDQVGSPTSAMSVASAVWKIVQMPALHGIHHWTDDGIASWYDFAVAIAEEGAALRLAPQDVDVVPITSRDYPTNIRRPAYSVLDKTSLATLDIPRAHWRVRLREALREIANG
jgi:dTDP-4-dehydrorhamnose reductase